LEDARVPSEVRTQLVNAYVDFSAPTGIDGAAARVRLIPEKDTSDQAAWILAERMAVNMSEAELAQALATSELFGPSVAQQVARSIFMQRAERQ
jgi:hypothetical protein